jgi:hypothetical protein
MGIDPKDRKILSLLFGEKKTVSIPVCEKYETLVARLNGLGILVKPQTANRIAYPQDAPAPVS